MVVLLMKYYLRLWVSLVIILLLVLSLNYSAFAVAERLYKPFEASLFFRKHNPIDKYILDGLNRQHCKASSITLSGKLANKTRKLSACSQKLD
jgi:hypothetical protein